MTAETAILRCCDFVLLLTVCLLTQLPVAAMLRISPSPLPRNPHCWCKRRLRHISMISDMWLASDCIPIFFMGACSVDAL